MDASYERSLYEATLDLDYAIRLAELHARLFSRIKRSITAVTLFAGSAAFVSLFSACGPVAGIAGLVVALLSTFDLVWDTGGVAASHLRDREAFLALRSRLPKLRLEQLDSKLDLARAKAAQTISALEKPAFNDNLRRHGRNEHVLVLNRWERFVHWIS